MIEKLPEPILEILDRLVFAAKCWLDVQKLDYLPIDTTDHK